MPGCREVAHWHRRHISSWFRLSYFYRSKDIIRYCQILSDSYGIIDHLKVSEVYEVIPFLRHPETSQATGYPLAYVAAKIALGDMAPVEC